MKYLHRLNKSSLALATILILSFSSCNEDKILTETPLDFLSPSNIYSTADEMEQAIYGLHEQFRENYIRSGNQAVVFRGGSTDITFYGEAPSSVWNTDWVRDVEPNNTRLILWTWQRSYSMVGQANFLIDAINKTEPTDEIWTGREEERASDLASARFFRAWAYRFLVTLWGDVPLLTEPVTKPRTDLTRDPKAGIYNLIIEDLEFASQNLPDPGAEKAIGRLNKAAALHLLADVYISQERWQDAINAATSVINDFGFELMQGRFGNQYSYADLGNGGDVYWDLFRYGNQNHSANTEDIWVIQYEPDTDGGSLNSFAGRAWGPQYWRIGSDPDGFAAIIGDNPEATADIYLNAFGRPAAWGRGTNYTNYDIWQSDWDNDIRNAPHNIFRDWRYNNPDSPWFGKPIDFVNDYPAGSRNVLQDTTRGLYPYFMKTDAPGVRFTDPNRQGGGSTHVDTYMMRLAETYLIRAEAYLGAGNQTLAAADINEVRNRAQATPVAPGDVSIEYILDERVRELYTEEFRLLVLYRLGLVVERTRTLNDNPVTPGHNIQDYHSLWPIPQSEIDLNVDAALSQNPGYGTN